MCTNSSRSPRRAGALVFVAALAFAAPARAVDVFATDWAQSAKSEARLISASARLAGFEIRLAPGAITYWRDPGDAGLPPTFDFSGSDNVASVEPVFPAPKRIREADGSEAFGYDGSVVFPFKVQARDPAKPVMLALKADFAVCEKVCLPAKADLKLALPAGGGSPYAGAIDAALAEAPRVVAPTAFGDFAAEGAGWRFCAAREAGSPRDLFVEAPSGWWVTVLPASSVAGADCFALKIGDKPKEAQATVALRLTLTGGSGPIETTINAATPHG